MKKQEGSKLLEREKEHIRTIYEQEKEIKELNRKIKELEQREVNIDTRFYTQTIRRQAQTIQYLQNELNKYRHIHLNVENT